MIIDASELPSEGMSSQQLINNIMDRCGSQATLDVIMRNMPQIARQMGAKRPAVLRNPPPQMVPPQAPPPTAQPPQQNVQEMPDAPKSLHTPPAKMVAGAEAVPKIPMTEADLLEFNKKAMEMPRPPMPQTPPPADPYEAFMRPQRIPIPPQMPQQQKPVVPSYFKDGLGNEYKILGNDLYVLGWQDAKVKVRMVNIETGKEIPSKGRKFQIYGWHLVEKMVPSTKPTEAEDVSKLQNSMMVEEKKSVDVNVSEPKEAIAKALMAKAVLPPPPPIKLEIPSDESADEDAMAEIEPADSESTMETVDSVVEDEPKIDLDEGEKPIEPDPPKEVAARRRMVKNKRLI